MITDFCRKNVRIIDNRLCVRVSKYWKNTDLAFKYFQDDAYYVPVHTFLKYGLNIESICIIEDNVLIIEVDEISFEKLSDLHEFFHIDRICNDIEGIQIYTQWIDVI